VWLQRWAAAVEQAIAEAEREAGLGAAEEEVKLAATDGGERRAREGEQ